MLTYVIRKAPAPFVGWWLVDSEGKLRRSSASKTTVQEAKDWLERNEAAAQLTFNPVMK